VRLPRERRKMDHRQHCEMRVPASLRRRGCGPVRVQIVRTILSRTNDNRIR